MKFLVTFMLLVISTIHCTGQPYVLVLGTAQDAGFPQAGCQKECQLAWKDPNLRRYTVSLAIVDPDRKKWWLIEATPDFRSQIQYFQELTFGEYPVLPEGIFLTHAHIGHYTGLIHLGREAMGAKNVAVYTLPKLRNYLASNGPWSQLVELQNIELKALVPDEKLNVTDNFRIVTFTVPHRDEYSETAGFRILLNEKEYLFIPDIDKWEKWNRSIVEEVSHVDYAFLDGPFFSADELPGRDMSEIPHPYIPETMYLFKDQPSTVKSKVHFIHFNHSNPVLWDESIRKEILNKGFNLAEQGKSY